MQSFDFACYGNMMECGYIPDYNHQLQVAYMIMIMQLKRTGN